MSNIVFLICLILVAIGAGVGGYWRGRRKEFNIWDQAELDGHITIHNTSFL